MPKRLNPQCDAFQQAIDLLGRPWTGLILALLQEGPLRYSQLRAGTGGAGDKILSARLKDLEARGLLERRVEAGPPVRVAYELTAQGRAFGEVGQAIERWGRGLVAAGARRRA